MNLAPLEQKYGLPEGLLAAVMQQESGGDSSAVSPKGAVGAFQLMPATAKEYGVDPTDPNQSAEGAAAYLGNLSKQFNGDVPSMLAGYNWGPGNVQKHGLENAPPETKNYINSITAKITPTAYEGQAPETMSITFPNGKVLEGVPKGLSKAEIQQKLVTSGRADEFGIGEKTAPESDTLQDVARPIARAARTGIAGLAAPLDMATMIMRGGAGAAATLGNAALGSNVNNQDINNVLPLPSDTIKQKIDALTNNSLRPQNSVERVTDTAGETLSGTGASVALAKLLSNSAGPITKAASDIVSQRPGMQAASAITAGGAGSVAKEMGGGTIAQTLASLAGAFAPSTINPRALFGIGNQTADRMQQNLSTFNAAGTTPTVAQATESRWPQAIESFLSRAPGSAGIMQKKATAQAEQLSAGVDRLAGGLANGADAETAGRAILRGIKGDFLPEARITQKRLYDKIDNSIQPTAMVDATNTRGALSKLTAPIEGAQAVSDTKLLGNAPVKELDSAITKDMGGSPDRLSKILMDDGRPFTIPGDPARNTMPYSALKEIRTRIGAKLENVDLAPDVPRAELKQLYGALSKDMETAAQAAGPKAYADFKRANGYTKALHDRIDKVQTVIDRNGGPERIFKAATAGVGEGATTLRAVMRSLQPTDQKMVSSAVLKRMGRATPGNQNDVGDVFSMNTYLTNWNKLSPQAKDILFNRYGGQFKSDMDKLAKVTSNIRDGSKVFSNPSGTAQTEQLLKAGGTLGGAVVAFFTGHPLIGAAAVSGMGTANLAARAMTNPAFVRWLAKNSSKSASALPFAIAELKNKNDPELKEIAGAMQ